MNRVFQGFILCLVVVITTSSLRAVDISFTEQIIGENFDVTMTVRAVDLDQDGDVDVIGGAYVDEGVKWWENDGNQNFIEHAMSGDYDTVRTVEFADMDGDGDVDVVSAALLYRPRHLPPHSRYLHLCPEGWTQYRSSVRRVVYGLRRHPLVGKRRGPELHRAPLPLSRGALGLRGGCGR